MSDDAVLLDVSRRLRVALDAAACHLRAGRDVRCSLALLPPAALAGQPHAWGAVDLLEPTGGCTRSAELIAGVGCNALAAALSAHVSRVSSPPGGSEGPGETGETEGTGGPIRSGGSAPPVGAVAGRLSLDVCAAALLLLPGNDGLLSRRRRALSQAAAPGAVGAPLRELLLSALLLSCHHKRPELWAHRAWLVPRLLASGELAPEVFHRHDRSVLAAAADAHAMNYNAWQCRRRVFVPAELWGDVNFALRFFETHNGDTSAAAYLVFLLERSGPAARGVWCELLAASLRELRRHCEKGHEAVWELRLALVQWGLREAPVCGWTLRDELDLVDACAALSDSGGDTIGWVDVGGSARWTAFYAARYGVQLLRMVRRSYICT